MSKLPACTRCGTRVPVRVPRYSPERGSERLCQDCDDADVAQEYHADREAVQQSMRDMVDEEHKPR